MKFKTKKKDVEGTYTRDGITVPVTRTVTTTVPSLPRDWNSIALRVAVGVSLALTVAVIVWSTVKIGGLLHGGVGYVAAAIFDIGWLMALLLAYMSRYNKEKRAFADHLGWAMLVATMGALFWAGFEDGSVAMGVVGAAVSLFAKAIWIGVMKHVNAELSSEDQAWVTAMVSEAQSKAAVAQIRRQTERIEQNATLELLAMEKERYDMRVAFGLDTPSEALEVAQAPEPIALEAPTLADMAKSDAIRFVIGQKPELEPLAVASLLADHGVDVKPEYVNQVLARMATREIEPQTEETNVINFNKENAS